MAVLGSAENASTAPAEHATMPTTAINRQIGNCTRGGRMAPPVRARCRIPPFAHPGIVPRLTVRFNNSSADAHRLALELQAQR